jgi:hypothetical protein
MGGKRRFVVTDDIISSHDEELSRRARLQRRIRASSKQHQPVHTVWLSLTCLCSVITTDAGTNDENGLCAGIPEILYGTKYVEVAGSVHRSRVPFADWLSLCPEVKCQHPKSGCVQHVCLVLPTLLVEAPSMGQHNAAFASTIHEAMHNHPILRCKRDALACECRCDQSSTMSTAACADMNRSVRQSIVLWDGNPRALPKGL